RAASRWGGAGEAREGAAVNPLAEPECPPGPAARAGAGGAAARAARWAAAVAGKVGHLASTGMLVRVGPVARRTPARRTPRPRAWDPRTPRRPRLRSRLRLTRWRQDYPWGR